MRKIITVDCQKSEEKAFQLCYRIRRKVKVLNTGDEPLDLCHLFKNLCFNRSKRPTSSIFCALQAFDLAYRLVKLSLRLDVRSYKKQNF